MKKRYLSALITFIVIMAINQYNNNKSKTIIMSDDVKMSTENMVKDYYVSQLNEYNFMPLAEDGLMEGNYTDIEYVLKNSNEKNINIILVKETNK